MPSPKALEKKVVTGPFLFFLAILAISASFIIKRYFVGIGAVSNMNDGYPWGIWIAYDVVIGTAFACGGYAMALLVYVFNKGEYHPLVRPALLGSLLGYTLAGVSVFIDIGRYWNAYTLFLFWQTNFNSVLLEVALCIASYILVLWIEFAPAFLEKIGSPSRKTLENILFVFIALGIVLPTMHQSSLGSVMILAGKKLSPLWWTGFLPLLFLLSALFMGYAVVLFEGSLAPLFYRLPPETKMLGKVSVMIPLLVGCFLVIRLGDLIYRGALGLALAGDIKGNMFLLEVLLHAVPLFILLPADNRDNARLLFIAACCLMLGGGLYRFNAYIIGFDPGPGWHYFPSVPEFFITFGIIAAEVLVYNWAVKKLPVITAHSHA